MKIEVAYTLDKDNMVHDAITPSPILLAHAYTNFLEGYHLLQVCRAKLDATYNGVGKPLVGLDGRLAARVDAWIRVAGEVKV